MINTFILLVVLLLFFCSALSLGQVTFSRLVKSGKPMPDAIYLFIGVAIYSNISWLANMLFLYPGNRVVFSAILLFSLLFSRKWIKSVVKLISSFFQLLRLQPLLVMLITLILTFLMINAFVVNTGWDEVAYHQPILREMSGGKIDFPMLKDSAFTDYYAPFSKLYGNFPYASESLAVIPYVLSGRQVAAQPATYLLLFIIFLTFLFWFLRIKCAFSRQQALLILLTIVLNRNFFQLLSTSYTDINVAIFEFVAVVVLTVWISGKEKSWEFVLTVVLGFLTSIKFSAIYLTPFVFIIYLITLAKTVKGSVMYSRIFRFLIIATLTGGFWYLKNLILFGNPVYPLFFGGKGIDVEELSIIQSTQAAPRMARDLGSVLNYIITNYGSYFLFLLGLAFFVFLFRTRLRNNSNQKMAYLFVAGLLVWSLNFFVGSQVVRYSLFILPVTLVYFFNRIKKAKLFFTILIFVYIVLSAQDPLFRETLASRYRNILTSAKYGTQEVIKTNLGCSYNVSKFMENNSQGGDTLNLWDPFLAVFLQEKSYFIRNIDSHMADGESSKYVYIHNVLANDFYAGKDFHKDIDVEGRYNFSQGIQKTHEIVFEEGNCLVYKIRS